MPPVIASEVTGAIDKLLMQFIREGRCTNAAASCEADGRFLVIAWEGPPLSGCSHDKIAQVIAVYEAKSGCALLAAPPIAIGETAAVRLTDRAGLRGMLASGACDAQTPIWDLRAMTLGAWRSGPVALGSSVWASLVRLPIAAAASPAAPKKGVA